MRGAPQLCFRSNSVFSSKQRKRGAVWRTLPLRPLLFQSGSSGEQPRGRKRQARRKRLPARAPHPRCEARNGLGRAEVVLGFVIVRRSPAARPPARHGAAAAALPCCAQSAPGVPGRGGHAARLRRARRVHGASFATRSPAHPAHGRPLPGMALPPADAHSKLKSRSLPTPRASRRWVFVSSHGGSQGRD